MRRGEGGREEGQEKESLGNVHVLKVGRCSEKQRRTENAV